MPTRLFHSRPESLLLATACLLAFKPVLHAAPTAIFRESPVEVRELGRDHWLVDFGKVTFGNLEIDPAGTCIEKMTVHFGEASKNDRIDRKPPGMVCYARVEAFLTSGSPTRVAPPADHRNTSHKSAIRTPGKFGVVLPFRWV